MVTGAATGTAVGAGAGGDLAGGELTGTAAGGGEATGTAAGGGELTGVTGVVVAGAGAVAVEGDAAGVVAAGLGEATGATGVETGVVADGVAGDVVGAAVGDWPPTPATTMQINASENTPLRSITNSNCLFLERESVRVRERKRGFERFG